MRERKTPFRPGNEISQTYGDGIVTIYRLKNTAKPGYFPNPKLVEVARLRYEERRLGLTRYYDAKQVNVDVERVLRVPRGGKTAAQDIAVTEDGQEYRIDLIQTVDGVFPPSLDLTLAKVTERRVTAKRHAPEKKEDA